MMEENPETADPRASNEDAIDFTPAPLLDMDPQSNSAVRTLDGEIAGDEFAGDAINYQILLGKIDGLLERLKLDA